MHNQLPIILTINAKYARAAFTVLQSILETSPADQKHDFYILHEDLPREVMALGRILFNTEKSSLIFLNISKEMAAFRLSRYNSWHRSTCYRLFIPLLFKEFSQALYLDSDVIAVRNLYEISQNVPKEACLAAVRDASFNPYPKYATVSFSDTIPYFNSGVLFFRPANIPEEQALWSLRLLNRPYHFPDQDILNLVYHDHLTLLPDRWNFLTGYGEEQNNQRGGTEEDMAILKARQKERPKVHIFHFICQKPWQVRHIENASLFWQAEKSLSKRAAGFKPVFERTLPL